MEPLDHSFRRAPPPRFAARLGPPWNQPTPHFPSSSEGAKGVQRWPGGTFYTRCCIRGSQVHSPSRRKASQASIRSRFTLKSRPP